MSLSSLGSHLQRELRPNASSYEQTPNWLFPNKRRDLRKGSLIKQYPKLVVEKLAKFKAFEITHVPQEENTRVDILSRLANTIGPDINHYFIQETKKTPTSSLKIRW